MNSDIGLLRQYATRKDAEAFAALVQRHAPLVYSTSLRVTANAHEAEDVTQECFLELARQAGGIESSLPGWLHRVATRRAIDAVRRSVTRQHYEEQAMAENQGGGAPSWQQIAPRVDEALDELTDELREPLVLHYLQGLNQSEVAEKLGVNQATVSRRLEKGTAELRDKLTKAGAVASVVVLAGLLSQNASAASVPSTLTAALGKMAIAGVAKGGVSAGASTASATLFSTLGGKLVATIAAAAVVVAATAAIVVSTQSTPRKEVNMASKVKRDGDKVWIEGVENLAGWGRGQENTFMGSLTAAMHAIGEKIDYDYLMGVSGQAFRVQIHQPDWSASAPDAGCGFNCMETAMGALGYTWSEAKTDPKKDPPENRKNIVESIRKGVPVVAMDLDDGMDWGVIAGFSQDGRQLLCRTYTTQDDDYTPHQKWPWLVWVIKGKAKKPDRKANMIQSLKWAVELANTKQYGEYASGFAAFEVWIRNLEDDARFGGLTEKELMRSMVQSNAWCYYSLYDARASASRYLRSIKVEFPREVADHLVKAAEIYEQITAALQKGRKFAPFPSEFKARPWTEEMRHAEALVLKDVLSLEKKAVAEIDAALTSMK